MTLPRDCSPSQPGTTSVFFPAVQSELDRGRDIGGDSDNTPCHICECRRSLTYQGLDGGHFAQVIQQLVDGVVVLRSDGVLVVEQQLCRTPRDQVR